MFRACGGTGDRADTLPIRQACARAVATPARSGGNGRVWGIGRSTLAAVDGVCRAPSPGGAGGPGQGASGDLGTIYGTARGAGMGRGMPRAGEFRRAGGCFGDVESQWAANRWDDHGDVPALPSPGAAKDGAYRDGGQPAPVPRAPGRGADHRRLPRDQRFPRRSPRSDLFTPGRVSQGRGLSQARGGPLRHCPARDIARVPTGLRAQGTRRGSRLCRIPCLRRRLRFRLALPGGFARSCGIARTLILRRSRLALPASGPAQVSTPRGPRAAHGRPLCRMHDRPRSRIAGRAGLRAPTETSAAASWTVGLRHLPGSRSAGTPVFGQPAPVARKKGRAK